MNLGNMNVAWEVVGTLSELTYEGIVGEVAGLTYEDIVGVW